MVYTAEGIDYSSLIKARDKFELFRKDMKTERDEAGAVQAFEYCYELSWKTMKRILNSRGLDCASPKEVFRKAGQEKLIGDPELWFEFQQKRNLTTHTYSDKNMKLVLGVFDTFSDELNKFIDHLERL